MNHGIHQVLSNDLFSQTLTLNISSIWRSLHTMRSVCKCTIITAKCWHLLTCTWNHRLGRC